MQDLWPPKGGKSTRRQESAFDIKRSMRSKKGWIQITCTRDNKQGNESLLVKKN